MTTRSIKHIAEEDLADYVIENDPKFKIKIDESFAEHTRSGGLEAGDLIAKLGKKLEKQSAKKV